MTEHDTQTAILQLIRYRGGVATRVNSGSAVFKRGDVTQVIKGAEKGTADIIAVYRGIYLAIEVKFSGGKASPEQIEFLESVARAGGIGLLAYGSEFVESVMNEIYRNDGHAMPMVSRLFYVSVNGKNRLFIE